MAEHPSVWTIPPGLAFVDTLAARLLAETRSAVDAGDPMALARYTILLPTRRACRSLAEAFLRTNAGAPLLLPRLEPIGDLDEEELAFADVGAADRLDLPPAIAPARRLLLLARLVAAFHRTPGGGAPDMDQATWLAHDLARLLDQVQSEELSFDRLAELVPDAFAVHWQTTLRFLEILTQHWPRILDEEGVIDSVARRTALIDARAQAWRDAPPADPVIAAGSTGSVPATARLIGVVAALPQGRVVLPGLDREMDEASWQALDPAHPQFGLNQLLQRLAVAREDVAVWSAETDGPGPLPETAARARLVSEAMRPAETSDAWQDIPIDRPVAEHAMAGVRRVDCPTPQEEAGVVAMVLREVLEETGKTGALVTLDRGLARRVAAELRRWGVDIDDSAGQPLAATPVGSFLLLTANLVVDAFTPVSLLAVGKHPLAAAGLPPAVFRARLRRLEWAVLRGPRPAPGLDGLRRALAALDERRLGTLGDRGEIDDLLDRVQAGSRDFAALVAGGPESPAAILRAHAAFAEALAASDQESGAERLWAGDAGEQAARLIAELIQAMADLPDMPARLYPGLLDALMAGVVIRPRYGRHPRLAIWGPLEARLQHADLIVLGGLNEGSWPREIEADPWMSRQMRARFGLPPSDRRTGLSAHDFVQAFCAREVVLTRSQRVEGTPTVPSRWLLRLDTVLRGIDPQRVGMDGWRGESWLHWQRALDAAARTAAIAPPAPAPPVKARPRRLSVTQVETWMRDPYAIYARHVLRLEALEAIDADPGAADYGTLIHAALDRFARDYPGTLPDDARERLLAIGRAVFDLDGAHPGVQAFWWPRFVRVADWIIDEERARRGALATIASEVKGRLAVSAPAGEFMLTAKADRIERRADGSLAVIDYKTGGVPTASEVRRGYAPQLPLEAAMAAAGGFEDVPAAPVAELAFWQLRGGTRAGEIKPVASPETLAEAARAGLERLVTCFDDPTTAYRAVPDPARAPRYSDYGHLARIAEWTASTSGDDS
ncbi:MAG: double-strand break repair protein AddB [Alphaproteobacteria bacterium]|nr:double-strand break repair protein AddB [Alphaproteobacteria bacterium]